MNLEPQPNVLKLKYSPLGAGGFTFYRNFETCLYKAKK